MAKSYFNNVLLPTVQLVLAIVGLKPCVYFSFIPDSDKDPTADAAALKASK